jgi:DNA-binding response OmpR family regulator
VKILMVEDDPVMSGMLARAVRRDGAECEAVGDGEEALRLARWNTWDLIVLDLILPRMDGFRVLHALRAAGIGTPVLVLTALSSPHETLRCLAAGANDVMAKPFSMDELRGRVRKFSGVAGETKISKGMEFDPSRRKLIRAGEEVELTAHESSLLEFLLLHRGRTLTRSAIADHVWGSGSPWGDSALNSLVAALSEKLGDAAGIKSVPPAGFRFETSAGS